MASAAAGPPGPGGGGARFSPGHWQPLWLLPWISSLPRLCTGWAFGGGEVLRAVTVPCRSRAQRCRLSWAALTGDAMDRRGPQRTCPQRPRGNFETLSLRSELKAGSCLQPQGREGLRPSEPFLTRAPVGSLQGSSRRGLSGGHEGHQTCPTVHEDGSLTQAWPDAEPPPSSEQSHKPGVPGG